jgi:hypothetical protein
MTTSHKLPEEVEIKIFEILSRPDALIFGVHSAEVELELQKVFKCIFYKGQVNRLIMRLVYEGMVEEIESTASPTDASVVNVIFTYKAVQFDNLSLDEI